MSQNEPVVGKEDRLPNIELTEVEQARILSLKDYRDTLHQRLTTMKAMWEGVEARIQFEIATFAQAKGVDIEKYLWNLEAGRFEPKE